MSKSGCGKELEREVSGREGRNDRSGRRLMYSVVGRLSAEEMVM